MSINKELSNREFLQREYDFRHQPYEKELEFYAAIKAGDIELVKKLYTPFSADGFGKLSEDSIRNIKYHLTITIAMTARFCIDGGMPSETAFTMSDIFINRLDLCTTEKQLSDLHLEMILEYTKRMKKISSGEAFSKQVLMCIDYIYDNIYNEIKIQDIADHIGFTPQYISKLFKKQVGVTLSDYIMSKRIQTAENMLKYTDYAPIDIANYLCFSSHSHFISAFKKRTGLTPKQYREKYYRIYSFDDKNNDKKNDKKG